MNRSLARKEWILALAVFLAEWVFGIYLGFHGILLENAMKRTASAFYVFNSVPYGLSAMGLVFNPLPSLLQLPFVLLAKIWRPIVTKGISMSFVSALFAAWGAKSIYRCFHDFECREWDALLITLLYCLNPYVFFYGANGMTEIMVAGCGIKIVTSMIRWMKDGKMHNLIEIAFVLVIMFLIRYEAVAFSIFVVLGMIIHMALSEQERKLYQGKKREMVWYMESTLWIVLLPEIFTVGSWCLYNWSITGNPFYFINSGYSMAGHSVYYTGNKGILSTVLFVFERVWPMLLPLLGILIARALSGKLLHHDVAMLVLVALAFPIFTFIMLLCGKSGGYVRLICYPLMLTPAFIPYFLQAAGEHRRLFVWITSAGMAVALAFFAWAFRFSGIFREDLLLNVPPFSETTAEYLNEHCRDSRVLMDSYRTYYIIMNAEKPENLVISSSHDYGDCIKDPVLNNVDFVVVPATDGTGGLDAINYAWPNLFTYGEKWAEEMDQIGEFKIFRVIR